MQCMSSSIPTSAPSPTGRRRPWGLARRPSRTLPPRLGSGAPGHRLHPLGLRPRNGLVVAPRHPARPRPRPARDARRDPDPRRDAYIWMGIADTERWRARTLLGIEVPRPYRTLVAPTTLRRIWERTKDPAVWRDLVYLLLVFFPLAIATFVIAVTVWASRSHSSRCPLYYGSGSGVQFGDGSRTERRHAPGGTRLLARRPRPPRCSCRGSSACSQPPTHSRCGRSSAAAQPSGLRS